MVNDQEDGQERDGETTLNDFAYILLCRTVMNTELEFQIHIAPFGRVTELNVL